MEMTHEEVAMMRLVNQAAAQGMIMAQQYQTREIMLFAPTGEVHRHPDISLVRSWLRHYAECDGATNGRAIYRDDDAFNR